MSSGKKRRLDVARWLLWLAGCSAAALLVQPKGLSLFAVLLALSTLLMLPGLWARRSGWPPAGLRALAGMVLFVLLVAGASMLSSGQGWHVLDNPGRLLLIPWCAWLAWATGMERSGLWLGSLIGLATAFALAVSQVALGAERAGGEMNPIVFANAVLALLVIALFCRPAMKGFWLLPVLAVATALAAVAIILSGSRGVLIGLAMVLLVLLAGGTAHRRWLRLGVAGSSLLLLFSLLWGVPWLSAQTRLDQVHADLSAYERGQIDTPIGARLALISSAAEAFQSAPLTGVGIDRFGEWIDASADCRTGARHFCELKHAHGDLLQWGATMGIPGILAVLAIYLVPLAVAVRALRRRPAGPAIGPYWACGVLVVACMLSGLTQSMFSHALTTGVYSVFVGLLLGMGMREPSQS